ncbi:MAG: DMT family transporter [Spirochaetia bacterium]|nr:DMT family transporter [Spirochaetia bacterium]
MMSKTGAKLLLTAVFIARGSSFLFSKSLMGTMPPMNILAVRFILAFLILALVFYKRLKELNRPTLRGGLILGLLYTVCMIFEMYGLRLVDSGVSALIENMAILFVPLYVAVWTRTWPRTKTLACAVMAIAGVGLLSLSQMSLDNGLLGITLIICAALTYGFCIIATEKVSKKGDPIAIGIIQLGVMGFISLVISLCTESFALPQTQNQWSMLLFLVLFCSCFGFTFQPVGQKYLSAETAAVLTVLNPLTASIMGVVVAHEGLTLAKGAGYIVILLALVIYNKGSKTVS